MFFAGMLSSAVGAVCPRGKIFTIGTFLLLKKHLPALLVI